MMAILEDNSWCADSDEICEPIKKEMFVGSSLIDSIGIGIGDKKNNEEQLSIAEILLLDYKQLTELKLLKYQTYIISQLKKYINQCKEESKNFDIKLHGNKLNWLLETTEHLAKIRKQHDVKIKKRYSDNCIQRNSYEFCNDFKCNYNKMGKCAKKHFVYNYVKCDINELMNYLTRTNDNKDIKEISITINTINYVFNHMHDELTNYICSKSL